MGRIPAVAGLEIKKKGKEGEGSWKGKNHVRKRKLITEHRKNLSKSYPQ